jgi:tetratricopeptide (TPR) repeat protein
MMQKISPDIRTRSLSRRQFLVLTLQLFALANLPGCRSSLPVLGKDPIKAPLIVENHSRTLARWAELGIRDAVVINFDTHDDFRWIPDSKIDELNKIYRRKDWQRFREVDSVAKEGLYHIGNWIYAGARLGIFKKVYWVIPYDFSKNIPDAVLRGFLKDSKFRDEDIKTFSLSGGQFHGSYYGIPVTVCGKESLPTINEPVLLSIDADFFPTFSDEFRIDFLSSLQTLFEALFRKNYRVQEAVVSYSVNGDYLHPHLRWVGDWIAMLLKNPEMLREKHSEMTILLQRLENAYRDLNAAELLTLTGQHLQLSSSAPLLLYKAYGHKLQGDNDNAYETGLASCRADSLYCSGLAFMANSYYLKGQLIMAEKFYRAAYSLNPEMQYDLFYYANCLRELGRFKEAIDYFKKASSIDGSFAPDFMIFATYLAQGDRQAALSAVKIATDILEKDIYAEVITKSVADSIYAAIDFCSKSGINDIASSLRKNDVIIKMFRDFPRQ